MFLGWPSIRFLQAILIGRKNHLLKVSGRFSNNFVEIFLRWPSIRFVKAMLISRKTWLPQGGAILPYMASPKLFCRFSNIFVEILLGWPSIRFLQAMLIGQKLWPPVGGAYMAKVEKKNRVSDPGPSWPSCFLFSISRASVPYAVLLF